MAGEHAACAARLSSRLDFCTIDLRRRAFACCSLRWPICEHVCVLRMAVLASEFNPDSSHRRRGASRRPTTASARVAPRSTCWCCTIPACRTPTAALKQLCRPGTDVSAHYVVLENGHIVQCVPEARRAWHAGQAFWAGETDINSCSIGIEIANPGHDYGYPDFPAPSDRGGDGLVPQHLDPSPHPGRPRARPFRRLARRASEIRARNFRGAFCTDPGSGCG